MDNSKKAPPMVELKHYHRRFCLYLEKGMKHYTQGIWKKIVKEYKSGVSQWELSRRFDISRYAIQCWIGAKPEKNTRISKQVRKNLRIPQSTYMARKKRYLS